MWTANEVNNRLVLHVRIRCGSLSITTRVFLLMSEFDFRTALQGLVSLAAVNDIYVFHEVINGCRNLKIQ